MEHAPFASAARLVLLSEVLDQVQDEGRVREASACCAGGSCCVAPNGFPFETHGV